MNRKILFRGKRWDNEDWTFGDLNQLQDDCIIHACEHCCRVAHSVNPYTIGQYTGLTDKNGVKIFEGDIIKSHYANAPNGDFIEYVVFHNGRFSATPDNAHCWTMLADGVRHLPQDKSIYMEWCEVIGNIHDNSELLQETSNAYP